MPDGRHDPVLVTGASGFVGCCAARRLARRGHEVHLLLRPGGSRWRLEGLGPRAELHRADLRDAPRVGQLLAAVSPRTVVHFATYGAYGWQRDGERILECAVLGTHHLLAAARAAGVRLFVNAGSSSEYGTKSEPMRETDRLEPGSVYAVAKAAQTHLCSVLAADGGIAAVTFRLFSIFGPWEDPARLFPTLIRRARAGLPLEMASPETAHDFLFVEDALDAMLAFDRLEGMRGEVLNLGSGRQTTLSELVGVVAEVVGASPEVRWGALPDRPWDTSRWQADTRELRRRLEWRPGRSLRAGVREMAEWMGRVGDDYGASAA